MVFSFFDITFLKGVNKGPHHVEKLRLWSIIRFHSHTTLQYSPIFQRLFSNDRCQYPTMKLITLTKIEIKYTDWLNYIYIHWRCLYQKRISLILYDNLYENWMWLEFSNFFSMIKPYGYRCLMAHTIYELEFCVVKCVCFERAIMMMMIMMQYPISSHGGFRFQKEREAHAFVCHTPCDMCPTLNF